MSPSMPLVAALSDYIAAHMSTMSPYAWEVRESAWKSLHTGFDYRKFAGNLPRQNIELKRHLSEHWAVSSLDEKIRVATWIVKDWGGINRNSEMTILSYVNQADAERPATPFFGIASYSKILSIKDPEGYAVFDARVAASLNAIQLLLDRDKRLVPPHLLVFFAPVGQNETINRFNSAAFPVALKRLGFSAVERNAIYGTYMASVHAISGIIHKSVLEIEMFLFAQAVQLSEEALPLARAIPPT
jgi:hypothetical protein